MLLHSLVESETASVTAVFTDSKHTARVGRTASQHLPQRHKHHHLQILSSSSPQLQISQCHTSACKAIPAGLLGDRFDAGSAEPTCCGKQPKGSGQRRFYIPEHFPPGAFQPSHRSGVVSGHLSQQGPQTTSLRSFWWASVALTCLRFLPQLLLSKAQF